MKKHQSELVFNLFKSWSTSLHKSVIVFTIFGLILYMQLVLYKRFTSIAAAFPFKTLFSFTTPLNGFCQFGSGTRLKGAV